LKTSAETVEVLKIKEESAIAELNSANVSNGKC